MEKQIYWITGFVASDEDKVYVNVHKLIHLGNRYIWVSMTREGGIGTKLDYADIGETSIEDAMLIPYRHLSEDEIVKIGKYTFDEMFEIYNKVKNVCNDELAKRICSSSVTEEK